MSDWVAGHVDGADVITEEHSGVVKWCMKLKE
jgi:hypothetical protein